LIDGKPGPTATAAAGVAKLTRKIEDIRQELLPISSGSVGVG
jgi:hypothetical protein